MTMRELAKVRGDDQTFISTARQHIENLNQLLRSDAKDPHRRERHKSWEPPPAGDTSRN
jgi:hypothetical protein